MRTNADVARRLPAYDHRVNLHRNDGSMQIPVTVSFRHMQPSPAVEARARALAVRLDRYYDRITGCHIVIEAPPAHRHTGAPFAVKIDATMPGGVIHVDSQRDLRDEHADVYVAMRDAFHSVRRQLQDFARRTRGDIKRHETPERTGVVAEVDSAGGFGRIESDERLIYFHRNSVRDVRFEELRVGEHVSFVEEPGDRGPQAVVVRRAVPAC
jgi:cold shock CspA family protein